MPRNDRYKTLLLGIIAVALVEAFAWNFRFTSSFFAYDYYWKEDVIAAPVLGRTNLAEMQRQRQAKTTTKTNTTKPLYVDFWDHKKNTIRLPEAMRNPFGDLRKTSLEILEDVLNGHSHQQDYKELDDFIAGKTRHIPECLRPNITATRTLATTVALERRKNHESGMILPVPIFNVGFPKSGSSTLHDFFLCMGYKSTHNQDGHLMIPRARKHNHRLLINNSVEAYMQLDYNARPGYYPQITLLDELHEEAPQSTFVMAFRPIFDWMKSLERHRQMRNRYSRFELPGMQNDHVTVLGNTSNNPTRENKENNGNANFTRITDSQLARFWCGHVQHIRAYVREYPSHKLIEVDLYDSNTTSDLLHQLFAAADKNSRVDGSSTSCWGHSNSIQERAKIKKQQKKAKWAIENTRGKISKQ